MSINRDVDRTPKSGLITQVLTTGPYSYLLVNLATDDEPDEHWVVSMRSGLEEGMQVRITPIGSKRGFRSARLGREFDELWFAVVKVLE